MSGVTVILPNARRVQVKTTPSTLLSHILSEACLLGGFEVSAFDLQTQSRKKIDLSLSFRLSGLPNNATLEMIPKLTANNAQVEIALQFPSGTRQIQQIAASSSLFEMLTLFEKEFGENLTGEVEGQSPCVVYMNRQYSGELELQSNTLSSLGISGKVLIRFIRTTLTEEQKERIRGKIEEEQKKKQALAVQFEKAKLENEERERIQREMEERFARELAEKEAVEEAKRKEEEEKWRREREAQIANGQEPMEVDGANHSNLQQSMPMHGRRDMLSDMPMSDPNAWSFDAPVFSFNPNQSRPIAPDPNAFNSASDEHISQLNRLLEQVDNSLQNPNSLDNLVDIVANQGRIPLSQLAQIAEALPAEPESSHPVVIEPCDRKAIIFAKEKDGAFESAEPVPDEFFEVKMEDLKSIQKDLREDVRQQTQRALLPKAFVQNKNRQLKMAAYKNTVIRLAVGEHVLQLLFDSAEPTSRLLDFVKSHVSNRQAKFSFKLAHIKIETSEKNFIELDLAPKATLVLKSIDIGSEIVLNELRERINSSTQTEADQLSTEWLAVNTPFRPFTGLVLPEESRQIKRPSTTDDGNDDKRHRSAHETQNTNLPKWFKRQ
ncbi:hypothetical protein WR25_18932 [Diploscapter pachys]|uniref:TUG ubiquitin-like domain-containing protein n=1 Tax=Diploscapter pachys TaxID=2018661 RepID=A0A2A2JBE2_9BILA|nr:hypothetical protein WR25_18932 [Diploscapter pachys]